MDEALTMAQEYSVKMEEKAGLINEYTLKEKNGWSISLLNMIKLRKLSQRFRLFSKTGRECGLLKLQNSEGKGEVHWCPLKIWEKIISALCSERLLSKNGEESGRCKLILLEGNVQLH